MEHANHLLQVQDRLQRALVGRSDAADQLMNLFDEAAEQAKERASLLRNLRISGDASVDVDLEEFSLDLEGLMTTIGEVNVSLLHHAAAVESARAELRGAIAGSIPRI